MNVEEQVEELKQQRQEFESLLSHQKKQITSRFNHVLEEQFWEDRQTRICKLIVSAFFPISVFYLIFEFISLPINYFTTEAQYRNHDVLMTLISYSTGWLALFSIYTMAKHPVWKNSYSVIVATVICVSMSVVQIVLFSTESLAMTWRGTLIIIFALMFAYLSSGLRPLHTFIAGSTAALITCFVIWVTGKVIPTWVLFNVLVLGNLVGLSLSLLTISTERIRFLQSIVIEFDTRIYELLNSHLTQLSHQDTLTLLGNRRSFRYLFDEKIVSSQNMQSTLAVLFIDVDYFKLFNDIYGHQQGDLALIRVAQVLKSHITAQDVAIRYGGEEFVIVLEKTNLKEATFIAEQILQSIRDQKILHSRSEISPYLTLSIGLTLYHGQACNYQQILKIADAALYESKRMGRNRLTYFALDDHLSHENNLADNVLS